MYKERRAGVVLCCVAAMVMNAAWAADPAPAGASAATADSSAELRRLKTQLDEQRKQIEQLLATVEAQGKLLEKIGATVAAAEHNTPRNPSLLASATPMVAPPSATPSPAASPARQGREATNPNKNSAVADSPTGLHSCTNAGTPRHHRLHHSA